tara:strand:+ start:6243 stop:9152 length:2910 start_codon:yes stop_codon:yes gene_type:complete
MAYKKGQIPEFRDGYDLINQAAAKIFTPDMINNSGPFLAMVLKVESDLKYPQAGWWDELANNFAFKHPGVPNPFANMKRIKVTARITSEYLSGQPDIDAWIPPPENPFSPTKNDEELIGLHNEFISITEAAALQPPVVGNFAWVGFLDMDTLQRPYYIEPAKGLIGACGGAVSASGAFQGNAASGAGLMGGKVVNNPSQIAGKPVLPGKPGAAKYLLHGYVARKFTRESIFLTDPKKRANMEELMAAIEIMHWYLQSLYPGQKVRIHNRRAGTADGGHVPNSAHAKGEAIDLHAVHNGKRVGYETDWAIITKLVAAGKIPFGGIGYYKTSSGRRHIKVTLNRDDLGPSGVPHWDHRRGKGAWIWHTIQVDGKRATHKKGLKGPGKGIKKYLSLPWLPKPAKAKFMKMPAVDSNMPTLSDVIKARQRYAVGKAPAPKKVVPSSTTKADASGTPSKKPAANPPAPATTTAKPPSSGSPTKPKAQAKAAEKPQSSTVTKSEKLPINTSVDSLFGKAKKLTAEEKKMIDKVYGKEQKKKKAKSGQSSSVSSGAPAAPQQNCAPGAPGQPGPGAPGRMVPGSPIEIPGRGKPKGLQHDNPKTGGLHQDDKKHALKNPTMFVCHETAGGGSAYSNAATFQARIIKGKLHKDGKPYHQGNQVHFWGGAAGDIVLTTDLRSPCFHATPMNWISYGYEAVNRAQGGRGWQKQVKWDRNARKSLRYPGIKLLASFGNVGGPLLGSGKGLNPPLWSTLHAGYTIPTMWSCERLWQTASWLITKPPYPRIKIPAKFPMVLNDNKLGVGLKVDVHGLGGKKVFVWGRVNPERADFKKKGCNAAWSRGLVSGRKAKADLKKHPWQQGIVAHNRWGSHTDGCFQEYYCLARAMKMHPPAAFYAAIGALALSNAKVKPSAAGAAYSDSLSTGATRFTFLPSKAMSAYGKKLWGNNGDLNWFQGNSSFRKDGTLKGPKKFKKLVGK